jgi:hypothetical protein
MIHIVAAIAAVNKTEITSRTRQRQAVNPARSEIAYRLIVGI